VEDLLIATLQKRVRHARRDLLAARNRQHVALGFGVGDLDQIAVAQPARLRQDRLRHRNVVVAGELADDFDGRIVERSKPLTELRERFAFDPLDQMAQDIIEHVDLLVVEAIGIGDEQIGNAPQRIDALVLGAALNGVLQLGNQ
jgi:hypothetical protein